MATRSKKPKCDGKTSQSCGMGCISREDTCREAVAENIATRLVALATQFKQANDAPGNSFSSVADNFPAKLLKAAHKTGVATSDLGNGAVLTTKEAVGLDGSKIKYGFVTDADGKRYTVSDGLIKEVTGTAGSEWDEAFQAAVRSKIAGVDEAPVKSRSTPKLSSNVEATIDEYMGTRSYKFSIGDNNVELNVFDGYMKDGYKGSEEGDEVSFSINGRYLEVSKVTKLQGAKIALTLASIIKYDVSTRPDGHKYFTNATIEDNNGYKRAAAYESLGFSRPVDGKVGGYQYGQAKDGRLVSDPETLKSMDLVEPATIERRMLENKKMRIRTKSD
jgi:hypothetical protein